MDKEQREQELKSLIKSTQGDALRELFLEEIDKMRALEEIEGEVELEARKLATKKLKTILHKLNLLKEELPDKRKSEYE